MCLCPITIKTPARQISKFGGQPLSMSVRCNKCAECLVANRKEWRFRAYHHAKDCINKGGYVYFDTLTYSEENVPHLSDFIDVSAYGVTDFMCFDYTHFKNFIKRLRSHLMYHFGDNEFTYFMASEYGTSETGTHRPHLHVNFYVKFDIHPFAFSKAVHDCWHYGRCDGIIEHAADYVAAHVYGYDCGYGTKNLTTDVLLKLCNYVSKYITKDSKFQSEIDRRLDVISKQIPDPDIVKNLRRSVSQYHRQSQGFGLSFLENMSDRVQHELFNNNCVILPSSDPDVIKTIPVPLYYKRKLFYKLFRRGDGSYYWQLTDKGLEHRERALFANLQKFEDNVLSNMLNALPSEVAYINKLLGNRTLKDFAVYKVFYKGQMRSASSDEINHRVLSDNESDLYNWIKVKNDSVNYNSFSESDVYIVDGEDIYINNLKCISKNEFIDKFAFHEYSASSFADFDRLDSFLLFIRKEENKRKQAKFNYTERLSKIFKISK